MALVILICRTLNFSILGLNIKHVPFVLEFLNSVSFMLQFRVLNITLIALTLFYSSYVDTVSFLLNPREIQLVFFSSNVAVCFCAENACWLYFINVYSVDTTAFDCYVE